MTKKLPRNRSRRKRLSMIRKATGITIRFPHLSKHEEVRSGCRALLSGKNDIRGRGSAVHCAADSDMSPRDVGNARPARARSRQCSDASRFVGMPEARIPLAQATVYVATAPKSNASYMGIEKALEDVKNEETMEVPDHLREPDIKGPKNSATARATNTRTTSKEAL